MALTNIDRKEATIIEMISAVSGISKKEVKEVLQSLCVVSSMEILRQLEEERYEDIEAKKELIVPYIGKLSFSYTEKLEPEKNGMVVHLDSKFLLSNIFKKELECILDGRKSPSQQMFEEEIISDLRRKLDIEEIEVED